jgi:hypothetical protein
VANFAEQSNEVRAFVKGREFVSQENKEGEEIPPESGCLVSVRYEVPTATGMKMAVCLVPL